MTKTKFNFDAESKTGVILKEWWQALQHKTGDRAALRRATEMSDILIVPAYFELYGKLKKIEGIQNLSHSLPYIAALLAQVKVIKPEKICRDMGLAADGDRAKVSELRFRRLIKSENREELFHQLQRILRILKNEANIYDIANSLFFWGENMKKQWAYLYYAHEDITKQTDSKELENNNNKEGTK